MYKTTGTLKEIGANVGDVVVDVRCGELFEVTQDLIDRSKCPYYRIFFLATPTGPVRTVTRKEIVSGVYGKVRVDMLGGIGVEVQELHDAEELTAAIATLTEIRDAL